VIDIGVNLLHSQFDADRDAVLRRAHQAGVQQMLITATDLTTCRLAIDFCSRSGLFCTAGIHPHDAATAPEDFIEQVIALARHPQVKAIGETGLDFNRNYSPADRQRNIFAAQIELAVRLSMPLFVHDRDSNGEVARLLEHGGASAVGVVIHCFTGTAAELHSYLDAGYSIGITGWVCDPKRGSGLREIVKEIPLNRLLIETDAPFLLPKTINDWPPHGVSGKHKRRNEPATLPMIAATLAQLMGVTAEELIAATTENARTLFQLP
jgi:TatD DNase family protein